MSISDVEKILDESGIGLPTYYEWRQRSGCTFCFFQRSAEWVGLLERHPDKFIEAKMYESERGGEQFYWRQNEKLEELEKPDRILQIKQAHERRIAEERRRRPNRTLIDLQSAALDQEEDDTGCDICHL